jgi:hypothetical protein
MRLFCVPLYSSAVLLCFAVTACAQALENRLSNPGFERVRDGRAENWQPFEQGYVIDESVRHAGARSVRCVNATTEELRGASYTLLLNQKTPAPLLVTGWSKAENVGGVPNSDYAIYVDLEYMDGTPLWGQTAPFAVGTHDWQRKQALIVPAKPLKLATIHALFRRHAGTVWFDDFSAAELSGNDMFDSQAIAPPKLPAGTKSGWFVRDEAANGPIVPLKSGDNHLHVITITGVHRIGIVNGNREDEVNQLIVSDTTGKSRAITVYYVERFDAPNPVWWNDVRQSAPAGTTGERANLTRVGNYGATGAMSLYPFGCITGTGKGRMVGILPSLGPRVARIGYHAGEKLLYVAFDLALTGENVANSDGNGHGEATVAVVRAGIVPSWGFRSAAATYYRLFPEAFNRRAKAEGLWIPFADPAKVQDVQDFGIAYHEGDNSIASDDRLGILSFRYTEPMTWWMAMPKETPRTYDAALQMVKQYAAGQNEEMKRWAQAVIHSGSYDENGKYNVEFINAPWTNGAVWTLNPNPGLPHPPGEWTKGRLSYTKEMADRMYGPAAKGVQDGEYLDSIEGWADVLDFRPESLKYAQSCPTFTTDTHRPVIPTWYSVWELANFMRDDLHRRGKLLMANSTPWRFWAFLPLLDVAGTETNWLPGGAWRPDSDAVFNLRRTLCYHKPYLLLQNTDFDKFGPEQVEKYFQRSMFYGVFPSMFSVDAANNNYWETPRWYNRDRALFKKYIPAVKTLSAAGWEPITYARSDNPAVYVERFGMTYLTVLNDSAAPARANVTLEPAKWGFKIAAGMTLRATDLVTGEVVASAPVRPAVRLSLSLQPEEGRALRFEMVRE